jgi:mono/diheme cytochrome c family protein
MNSSAIKENLAPVGFMAVLALLLGGVFTTAVAKDTEWRGELDPVEAETPQKLTAPFAQTRSEARLKAMFSEPAQAAPLPTAAASSAKGTTNSGNQLDIPEAAMLKARKIYQERCASCHGDKGDGKGPGAFAINPKPRDYTNAEWQKTVTDDELTQVIVRGGAAVGKSYMMPANRDLRSKPDVAAGLVQLVRSFATSP